MVVEERKKRFLVVFGHGRRAGLGCELRDFVCDELAQAGFLCRLHNLLEDGFDPVLRLGKDEVVARAPRKSDDPLAHGYAEDVQWADIIVFLHPVWWFSMPAILKGWVDRILVEGIAIAQDEGNSPKGLLGNKGAVLVQTFGTNSLIEKTVFRGLAQRAWKKAIFLPTGLAVHACLRLHGSHDLEQEDLIAFKTKLKKALLSAASS